MRVSKQLLSAAFALTLTASFGAWAQDGQKPWTIKADMKPKVEDFIRNSDIVKEMHEFKLPNTMVYSVDALHGPMLPVYDILACLHLTHPNSKMEVDSGGGYDISMQDVQFSGGVWDAEIRFREVQQIDFLESQYVYLLDRIIVGTTRLRDINQRTRLVRQLSKACFATAPKE